MNSKATFAKLTARNVSLFATACIALTATGCGSLDQSLISADATQQLAATPSTDNSAGNAPTTPPKAALTTKERLAELQQQHAAAPHDPAAALAYAHALKSAAQLKAARQVLTTAHANSSTNVDLAGALGLIELELGQAQKAQKFLLTATSTPTPDWRYLSGLGVAYAIQGKQSEAQKQFNKALALAPNNKAILNNLAMSYMLEKRVEQAESLLKQAKTGEGTPAEVAQNLTLATKLRASGPRVSDAGSPISSSASESVKAN